MDWSELTRIKTKINFTNNFNYSKNIMVIGLKCRFNTPVLPIDKISASKNHRPHFKDIFLKLIEHAIIIVKIMRSRLVFTFSLTKSIFCRLFWWQYRMEFKNYVFLGDVRGFTYKKKMGHTRQEIIANSKIQ